MDVIKNRWKILAICGHLGVVILKRDFNHFTYSEG